MTTNKKAVEASGVKKIVPEKVDVIAANDEAKKPNQPALLNQKRTKMIAEQENAEVKKESNEAENPFARKIIKARRRFNDSEIVGQNDKEESTRDDADVETRGKFVLKGSLGTTATTDSDAKPEPPKFNFANSLKMAQEGKGFKADTDISKNLGHEAKMFANKNLFSNPMVKQLPPVKSSDEPVFGQKPTMKRESEPGKRKSFVQTNPLNSTDALRVQKSMSRENADGTFGGSDSPVVKSLFDVKGNSKYKADDSKDQQKKSFLFDSKDKKRLSEMSDVKGITIKAGAEEVKSSSGPFAKPVNPFENKGFKPEFKPENASKNPFTSGVSLFSNPFAADRKSGE